MKVAIRVDADRPEVADISTNEMFNEISLTAGLAVEHPAESSANRRSRMGGLEFVISLASSAAVVKLVDVLLAHVNKRSVKIELKKADGTTLKIAAHGEGTQAAQDIIGFLTHSETPLGGVAESQPNVVSAGEPIKLQPGAQSARDGSTDEP